MSTPMEPVKIDAEIWNKMKSALILAEAVRQAQKQYFKTRSQDNLVTSKRLETSLDVRLAELRSLGL